MSDNDLAVLARRLEAVEKTLIPFRPQRGDPPPDDVPRVQIDILRRLEALERAFVQLKIDPRTDPSPEDYVGLNASLVRSRLGEIVARNPGWITDPPPDDFLNVRVLDLIRRFRGGFTDPAPEDLAHVRLRDLLSRIPGGGFTDPSPEDVGRLTLSELKSHLHRLGAEMVRLRALERVMQERVQQLEPGK